MEEQDGCWVLPGDCLPFPVPQEVCQSQLSGFVAVLVWWSIKLKIQLPQHKYVIFPCLRCPVLRQCK